MASHLEPKVDRRTLKTHLKALRSAFSPSGVPCSVGTFPAGDKDLILYYGKPGPNEVCRRLNFSDPSEDDLRKLAEYCDPATFGRDSEAVLDEAYRKAGKLDIEHFSTFFDPTLCGLISQLEYLLLEGHDDSVGLRSELYKLNVYGPGSFFKTHKDTPRGNDMFASLVVVLPTRHTGGALKFQHDGHSLHFDSAQAIADAPTMSIAYAAFFSDIDHEVDVVETGYRVTLTYNLYYKSRSAKAISPSIKTSVEDYLRQSLQDLMDDKTALPDSGLLGFCLRHQYSSAALENKRLLKGSDAVLAKVCDELGLKTYVRVIYIDESSGVDILTRSLAWMPDFGFEDESLCEHLCSLGGLHLDRCDGCGQKRQIKVHWVTEMHAKNVDMFTDIVPAYGNEPAVDTIYSYLCFIVEVNRGKDSAKIGRPGVQDSEESSEGEVSEREVSEGEVSEDNVAASDGEDPASSDAGSMPGDA